MRKKTGASSAAKARPSTSGGGSRPGIVLSVDDDPLNLKLTKAIIEGLGHLFIGASSGRECIRMLETVNPHVILLDIMMPDMNGFETCRQIREKFNGAGPRIIYLTARNMVDDVKSALETGADDYLVKPLQMSVLETRLRHWLSQTPRKVHA